MPSHFVQHGIYNIIHDTDCPGPYSSTKNKSSTYHVEFEVSANWRKCVLSFRQSNSFLAIGEWRSVSVNPDGLQRYDNAVSRSCKTVVVKLQLNVLNVKQKNYKW